MSDFQKRLAKQQVPLAARVLAVVLGDQLDLDSGHDPWVTIFQLSFPQPIRKCYLIVGIDQIAWVERICDEDAQCPLD